MHRWGRTRISGVSRPEISAQAGHGLGFWQPLQLIDARMNWRPLRPFGGRMREAATKRMATHPAAR